MKETDGPNSKKHGVLTNLFLMLISLFVGLLLCEVAARFLVPVEHRLLAINQSYESERGKFCQYNESLGWTRPAGRHGCIRGAGRPGARSPRIVSASGGQRMI